MAKKIILWVLVILVSAQIFSFSSDNSKDSSGKSGKITEYIVELIEDLPFFEDTDEFELREKCEVIIRKGAHFSIYLILALVVFELARSYNIKIRYCLVIAALYSLFYAISDEIHQLFVDGRSGEVKDVLIDFSGASFGLVVRILTAKFVKLCRNSAKNKKI